jgi:hypothetical protein
MSAFNSDEYAWKDIKVVLGGRPVTGIRGVKFKTTRKMTDIYASGDNPHTRTKGNKSYSGEIKLLQSEVEALLEAAGQGKDLTDITVNITVAFAASLDARIKTHQLITCDFPEFEMGMEQDDPNMEVTIPMMIGKIKYNV